MAETVYYCKVCNTYFIEEEIPNINKIHRKCGNLASIVSYKNINPEDKD